MASVADATGLRQAFCKPRTAQNASQRWGKIRAELSGKVHQKTARKCTKSGAGNSGGKTKNRIADFMKRANEKANKKRCWINIQQRFCLGT
jgi:hypothetical protein